MNAAVREWIDKAEGDWRTANRELRIKKDANYDAVCFHAQQCAEKYLKAFLQANSQRFPKTHNLTDLLELALKFDKFIEMLRDRLEALNIFAVLYRYPGETASRENAKAAVHHAAKVRDYIRQLLLD